MRKFFKRLVSEERGATAIEYGLIAGLIAVVVIGALTVDGTSLRTVFETVSGELATWPAAAAVTVVERPRRRRTRCSFSTGSAAACCPAHRRRERRCGESRREQFGTVGASAARARSSLRSCFRCSSG